MVMHYSSAKFYCRNLDIRQTFVFNQDCFVTCVLQSEQRSGDEGVWEIKMIGQGILAFKKGK